MARSVGSIEVRVDADTGRLKAQLTKDGSTGGKEFKKAFEAQTKQLNVDIAAIDGRKEAALLRKQLEAALRGVETTLDMSQARQDLREFEALTEAINLALDVSVDLSDEDLALLSTDWRAFKEKIEADKIQAEMTLALEEAILEADKFRLQEERDLIEMRAALSMALAENEVTRFREEEEANAIDVDFNLQSAQASVELAKWRQEQGANAVEVNLDLKLASATTRFEEWLLAQSAKGIDTDVDPNTIRATIQFQQWIEAMEKEDIDVDVKVNEAGGGFDGLNSRIAKIGAAILALGESLGVALQGATAAATSVLSSAIQGLGAAAGAAVPLVFALGAALTAGIVGAQGFGDALKEVNKMAAAVDGPMSAANERVLGASEAFQNLAPSARAAAFAFADIRDELGDLRTVVQQDLFTGMRQEIQDLGATVLPNLQEGLRISAQSINEFAKGLSDVAQNTDFKAMIQAIDPALDDAFDSGVALVDTLEPFLLTAAPAAERLAEMIERGAEGLRDWMNSAEGRTNLAEFLDNGLTSLQRWVDLLQATGGLLGSIFDAGAESGDSFVISLTNIFERWEAWMEDVNNAASIEEFFDSGRQALEALQPVLEAIKDGFGTLVDDDAMTNFEAFGQAIADMIPALVSIMALLSDVSITNAIALLVQGLGGLAEILNMLPDGLLEFAGIVIVATKAVSLLPAGLLSASGAMIGFGEASIAAAAASAASATGVGALSAALKLLVVTNAPLLILAATVTGVMLAFKVFGDSSSDATERTNELTIALQNEVDALISSGDAAESAAPGFEALNNAIFETGKGGDKIDEAFQKINEGTGNMQLGVEDTVRVMEGLKGTTEETVPGLTELAEGYGLSGDAAQRMAEIVAGTDDNMDAARQPATDLGQAMVDLAEQTGLPVEEIIQLFGSLEELQDQAENTNIDEMAAGFLNAASTMDGLEGATWAQVDAMRASGEIADDNVVAYNKYVELLTAAKLAADDTSSVNGGLASSYILVQDSIQQAIAAHEAEQLALEASRAKAFDAYQAEKQLASATEDAAVAILTSGRHGETAAKNLGKAADEIVTFGESMRDAAGQADALSDALDFLLNPFLDLQEAESAVKQNTDDLSEALAGGTEVMKKREEAWKAGAEGDAEAAAAANAYADGLAVMNRTLDLNLQAGRDNAEQIRTNITGITDFATAQLAAGAATEDVVAAANASRDALIFQASGFFTASEAAGTAEQQATDYVNALGLTPELINTVFSQPGLIDALLNAEDLTLLYDDAGNPVITEFEALGIDPAMASVSGFQSLVENLDQVTGQPVIAAPTVPDVTGEVEELQTGIDTVDTTEAVPAVSMPTIQGVTTDVETLQTGMDTLDATAAIATISIPGLQTTIDKVNELKTSVDRLPTSKTITITTVNRTISAENMTGSIIGSPTLTTVGERGYAEAIVPLQLPLNRVDPSVRHFAEILRGGGSTVPPQPGSPGKVVNNYMTITPQSADPTVVATQIINRSASMANR